MSWLTIQLHMAVVALFVVALDQVSKLLVVRWLGRDAESHHYDLIGSIAGFHYIENTGAAFGMLRGYLWLVSLLAMLVAVSFVVIFRSDLPRSGLLRLSVALVLGGAIGNLIDRLVRGYVVDFIGVASFHRFNLADSAITIGIVLLAWVMLRHEWAEEDSR